MKTKNIKTKYKALYICLLAVSISLSQLSCTKSWLDKKPDISTTIPATLKDCQALLDANDFFNTGSPGLSEVASDGHYINSTSIPLLQEEVKSAYTWTNNTNESFDWNATDDHGPYGKIFTCNLILETLNKIPENIENKVEFDNVKGQALFLRGKIYYELSQTFAAPYQSGGSNDGLGLPLRLETDINIPSVRSNIKETYYQIIKDLSESRDLLPIKALYKTRASKVAAFAMLARVYLSMENYSQAGENANEALKINPTLMDYSKLNPSASFPISLFNDEVIFHSTLTAITANTSQARIDPDLKAMYHPDDLRNSIFFTASSGQFVFKGYYYGGRLCFNGMATDELYLIRAESYARAGKLTEAMVDVNFLLKNRWKKVSGVSTYIDQIVANSDQALTIVLNERKKELLLRGLRWSDLRRLNRDSRFAITVTRVVDGKTYSIEPNSYKYTFAIPRNVIQKTGMPQNAGWE
jgi:tetratricopeptide (TPR) repeat protein